MRLQLGEDGALVLEVTDTGVGIDTRFLPRLFEPFVQESSGYTRAFEGPGLGLALTRRYLELNGARVSVESLKGKGSTFRVTFPVPLPDHGSTAPPLGILPGRRL